MSLTRIIQTVKSDLKTSLIIINHFIKNDYQKYNFALATTNGQQLNDNFNLNNIKDTLKEIFDDFLWHAPRKRRPIETRLRRRFGYINKHIPTSKLIKKKHNLVICNECGNWHELENICQICYLKVKEETKLIQDTIMAKLGLNPVEKEVKFKYENDETSDNNLDNNYFVEIPKKRPVWFAANLISNNVNDHLKENKKIVENNDLEGKLEK